MCTLDYQTFCVVRIYFGEIGEFRKEIPTNPNKTSWIHAEKKTNKTTGTDINTEKKTTKTVRKEDKKEKSCSIDIGQEKDQYIRGIHYS